MRWVITAGLGLVVLGAACAADTVDTADETAPPATAGSTDAAPGPASTAPPNGMTVDVRSLDNSFVPASVEIEAGTEIRWVNGGRNDHNVLPADDTLEWGVERDLFTPTDEYTHVFGQPGVYPYYCSIHGTKDAGMVGVITVIEPT